MSFKGKLRKYNTRERLPVYGFDPMPAIDYEESEVASDLPRQDFRDIYRIEMHLGVSYACNAAEHDMAYDNALKQIQRMIYKDIEDSLRCALSCAHAGQLSETMKYISEALSEVRD